MKDSSPCFGRLVVQWLVVAICLEPFCAVLAAVPPGASWPAWRGDGSGCSLATHLPVTWDATNHMVWRSPLPGEGSSSPIVWAQRVFLTASTDHGTNRLVLCFDAQDGHVIWRRQLVATRSPNTDPKAGYAPATPATDGQRLYVFFDAPGLMAFDMDGNPLWTLPLGPFKSPYNITASPVVFRDRVIQCCDQGRDGYILAADSATGRLLWKTPRRQGYQYGTPLLLEHAGAWQVVVGATTVKAYDPTSGAEIWSCAGLAETVAPSPVAGDDGLVYATSGRNGPSLAIDPGGTGTVTETHLRMQVPSGGPYVPSPLYCCGLFVVPGDDGVVRAINARGEMRVAARLHAHFTASPVRGGRFIYWASESGETFVLDTDGLRVNPVELPVVAVNPLGEQVLSSPAIAGNRIFVRTTKALYCLAGGMAPSPVAITPHPAVADFAEWKRRFETHPAEDGEDIPVRLAVVDAMSAIGSAEAAVFLKDAARKDPHWDVCEAAAKALAGMDNPAAVAGLLELAADRREYMKIIAAGGLGRLRVAEAVPVLLKGLDDKNPLVRIARLQALAEIGTALAVDAGPILSAVESALADAEVAVRLGAVRSLAVLAGRTGIDPARIEADLNARSSDPNPAVADAARAALPSGHGKP